MRYRSRLLLCAACLVCWAGLASRSLAQKDEGLAFNPEMSLEQTVAWLGRQLTHVSRDTSADGKYIRRFDNRMVKAKGCTFSYSVTSAFDTGVSSASEVSETRELWTLDLARLDPETVRVTEAVPGLGRRVRFDAATTSRNAIRTSVFRNERLSSTHNNRPSGYFAVRDETVLSQAAAALSHAAALCRQKKS